MNKVLVLYQNLLLENKPWLLKVSRFFLLSITAGVVVFFYNPGLLQDIFQMFADKFGEDPALDFSLAMDIFTQNLAVSVIALFAGVILGIAPFLVIVVNGFILGYVLTSIFALSESGIGNSILLILLGLVPHGIFEIPAFLIAAAFGLRLGINFLKKDSSGQRKQIFVSDLRKIVIIFPLIVLALFVAAVIEVFISGNLVN